MGKRPPRSARCHPARAPASRLPGAPSPADLHDSRGPSLALPARSPRREESARSSTLSLEPRRTRTQESSREPGADTGGGVSAATAPYLVQALPAGPGGGGDRWPCRLARGWASPPGRSGRRRGKKRGGKRQGRKLRKGGTAQERVRQKREEKWEKRESKKECSHAIFESKIKNIKAQPNIPS